MKTSLVCPYLFRLTPANVAGPLSQFQAKLANRNGTLSLVRDLNRQVAEDTKAAPLPEKQLDTMFETFWPRFEKTLSEIAPSTGATHSRTSDDMFDEIAQRLHRIERGLPVSVQSQVWTDLPGVVKQCCANGYP